MKSVFILLILFRYSFTNCQEKANMNYNKLTDAEKSVIINKGTEAPFTGIYNNFKEKGTYNCKRCDAALFKSDSKFESNCGWPSFDDEIEGAVKRVLDKDGHRTEIVCANCGAHLGHVFEGEGFTVKNTRHCVNSVSLNFSPVVIQKTETAIFASGCFWGTEYWLQKQKGVLSTTVGYIGGKKENPSYEEVCSKTTGYAEAVKVVFNPDIVSYEELCIIFFNTHDPSQIDRQGPDIGEQYRSEVFYMSEKQKEITEKLIKKLEAKGITVATKLSKASKFWDAEDYHQDYYKNKGAQPYCHFYREKF
ncbi:MAG: bifunctional methionine sulfoxide reductase B/A protein [Bacteroidales bacterium]|nr:bifunctional methionine sulfoxide reductase B/A protein [Bacteroidales bacterium]